ncbi:MAG: vWA domain-containing protein [Myxococcales bacterium]
MAPVPMAEPAPAQPPTPPVTERPKIDVVFALDTTSSMTGLLEGAKQKIWSMASHIASGKPTPELRVGLVAFRDRGDAFVTKVYPLTTNLDDVYANLRRFKAEGGGDPPEDVKQALLDSMRKMAWTPGKAMRLVFLVGDSPPHDDYSDQPSDAAIAAEARRRGIVINSIRCGDLEDTAAAWRSFAKATGGAFSTIGQDGGMVAVRTPLDDRLRELNARMTETAVFYGADKDREAAERRAETNRAMAPEVQAESARYRALSGYVDSNDIVTQAAQGRVKVEDLPAEALPAPMRAMAPAQRKAYVEEKKAEREKLASEVKELSKKRDDYLRSAAPAPAASFDEEVKDTVAKQAKSYGIAY